MDVYDEIQETKRAITDARARWHDKVAEANTKLNALDSRRRQELDDLRARYDNEKFQINLAVVDARKEIQTAVKRLQELQLKLRQIMQQEAEGLEIVDERDLM